MNLLEVLKLLNDITFIDSSSNLIFPPKLNMVKEYDYSYVIVNLREKITLNLFNLF